MSASELLVLSLGLSVMASALAWLAASLIERVSPDPRLRDGVWGAGLLLGAVPPLAVAAFLLAPAPVREVAAPAIALAPLIVTPTVQTAAVPATATLPDLATLAALVLAVALGLGLLRLISLTVRIGRLTRLLHQAVPADADLTRRVEAIARDLDIRPPSTVVSPTVGEALLSGFGRPRLILPAGADQVASDAVIAHELAHLKRGDHRTLWVEEALVVVLAINPLIPLLRARRDTAREEACDALALRDAAPEVRRAYAQTLIDALRSRAAPEGMGSMPALTFTGAGRTSAMHRLKAVMTPAAPAGRRVRLIALSLTIGLVATVGAASWAVADQRPVRTVVRAETAAPTLAPDFAYVSAALDPIYKAAWPAACGFGSESDGRVFVHAGDCATGDGSKIEILSLAGVGFSTDAREVFAAVKASCDAGRPIEVAYVEDGARGRTSVACLAQAVAPHDPVRFTIDLSYDPAIRIAAGDRLEIELKRDMEGGGTASKGIVLDLAPGAMPGQAFADLRPPVLPADLRAGPMPALSARIVAIDGTVKALSDRDLDRPHAPYLTSVGAVSTAMRMLPSTAADQATSAARMAVDSAAAALPPGTAARFQRASASDYRTYCASADPAEEGFCAGVLFSHLARTPANGLCVPEAGGDRQAWLATFVARGKAEIARLTPRRDEGAYEYSERALKAAYSCQASARPAATTLLVAPQAYQARITIRENGRIVASDRLPMLPNGDALTTLTVDGVSYRFDLRLSEVERRPDGQDLITTNAHVERTLPSGGWETISRPRLVTRTDGEARMTWGHEPGLLFDIVVEPV